MPRLRFSDGAPRPPASTTTPLMRRAPESGRSTRRAARRNHALLADSAGAFLPTPPRRPTAPAAPAQKRPNRARVTAAECRNGRGLPMATVASSVGQHTYHTSYYCSGWGIFLTEGFQATIRLPEVPCTLHVFEAGLVCRLAGWAGLPGATFCPLCREYLGGTCAPVGWPRCKSSGELRQERQYRD